jgi:hypothetical protein
MSDQWKWASYERVKEAAEELKGLIRAKYPDAEFRLARDPDQRRSWLLWTVVAGVEDPEDVSKLIVDREEDMLSEEHIPIHVIPIIRDPARAKATTATIRRVG